MSINSGGGILVQKHDAGKKHFPNKYDIPSAGHVHAGEKPIEAYVRETKEELGIDTKEDDFVFLTEWKFDIFPKARESAIRIHKKLGFIEVTDKGTESDIFLRKLL